MKNRKSVMALSALLILVFHLWTSVFTGNPVETFLHKSAFIGVDMFFFLSGFSLAQRRIDHYFEFEWARFKAVYLRFILFAIVAFLYSGWSGLRLLKVVTSIELFEKGGGSFLWFLPGIMIIYLLFPLFQRLDEKNRIAGAIVAVSFWILMGILGLNFQCFEKTMILWNRLPIFFLGYYVSDTSLIIGDVSRYLDTSLMIAAALIVVGNVLIYNWAYMEKLRVPFQDMFYLMGIPAVVGWVMVASRVPENKVIGWIGSATLEMYGIQMIFGFKLAGAVLKAVGNPIVANVVTILVVTGAAVLVNQGYLMVAKRLRKK